MVRLFVILLICVLFATQVRAEDFFDKVKQDFDYEITLKPKPKEGQAMIVLSSENEKIARAISEASAYAILKGEDNSLTAIVYEQSLLLVKGAEGEYQKTPKDQPFIDFIFSITSTVRANGNSWRKYFDIFYKQEREK